MATSKYTQQFLHNKAKDYDLQLTTVEWYAENTETAEEFYDALENHYTIK